MEIREFIDNHLSEKEIVDIATNAVEYHDGTLTDYKTFERDLKKAGIELKEILGWDFEDFGIDTKYVFGYLDSCMNPHYVGIDTYSQYLEKCKESIEKYFTLIELKEVLGIEYHYIS